MTLLGAGGLAGAYLFALLPSNRREWMKDFDSVHYAHRGLYDNEKGIPENSLAAFRNAIDHGYGMEMDVQISSDGIPVVFHDDTLDRMARDADGNPVHGRVIDRTFEELRRFHLLNTEEKIPSFQEFLDLVQGRVPLIIELKTLEGDRECRVCAIADRLLQNYNGKYAVESFNPYAVRWYRRHRPEITRGQLSEAFTKNPQYRRPSYFASEHLLLNCMTKPDFIAYNAKHHRNLSRRLVRRVFHAPSVAWTIQSADELKEMNDRYDLFIFEGFMPE